jgi:hypothetical protein
MMVSYTEANEMNLEGMNAKTILALFMIVAAIGVATAAVGLLLPQEAQAAACSLHIGNQPGNPQSGCNSANHANAKGHLNDNFHIK